MTLAHFKAVRANTEQFMKQQLYYSHHVGYPLQPFCAEKVCETVTIEEEDEDLDSKIYRLAELVKSHHVVVSGDTRPSGRYDYFKSVSFTVTRPQLRTEIFPEQVQSHMKEFVKRELGLGNWDTIHCRVMDLFKQGLIEWDEVVKAHGGNCSL